ncbi:MAG: molybdopterin-guanine dinucleotide biosynthesis protein B [Proteobacteria bacterium]|nr:MAG: molybdopterin-guanine dinucleotide biosynthesis protein B [Pseudomonadota bacterium]
MSKNAKTQSFQFHPLELSIVGYSGVGKTTLIEKLIDDLKSRWAIAYVKHDAHRFQMDREGKDTFRARAAGADAIYIADASQSALLGAQPSFFLQKSLFFDQDAALIEGYKSLSIPKLIVLGEDRSILEEVQSLENVLAFIGAEVSRPDYLSTQSPYFHRDDHKAISSLIENFWLSKIQARPLRALILAGGRSERMGRDKALISYQGQPQFARLYTELWALDLKPVISLREDQWPELDLNAYTLLKDRFLGLGPLGGILTALHDEPNTAWLVVACDLPLLDKFTIQNLIASRDPLKCATAYRSTTDGLPEPLCAIYEPKMKMRLHEALSLGYSCPRKVLINTASHIIDSVNPDALANANTPDDYSRYAKAFQEFHS